MAKPRPRAGAAYHHGDLRAELIAAATTLVREHGGAAFSLREAARAVGVDAAACYRHFRDRGEVLVAIAQDGFTELANRFSQVPPGRSTARGPRAQIVAMGQRYFAFAQERPAEFRLMFGECGLEARDPRLRGAHVALGPYDQLLAASAAFIDQPVSSDDASRLTDDLWAATHGVTRLAVDGAIPIDRARPLLDRLLGTVLDAVGAAPRTTRARRSTRVA